jgi:hypothetical protein
MPHLLLTWLICFVALALAVGGLAVWYRLIGSEFDGKDFWFEVGVIGFAAAAQRGVIAGLRAMEADSGAVLGDAMMLMAVVATFFIYKVTHYEDMSDTEIFTICLVNIASWLALTMLADAVLGG